ncbi:non-ribosomal peptide synthetase, partial [Lysobacter sp. Root604]|uniref:non-ribosomal peptide synthetase n=1 Tax=Lysobacter sp. Root604 TaxID=1736568 RepID=UPI0019109188
MDLFDRSTVERLAGHFMTVLEAMAVSDAQAVATLPIMTAVQRAQVLEGFNATATDYPKDALIHELFERQATAQPDAVAVVYEDHRLTYGELNARANQVAHYLLSQGVKPDDRVAICVERSLEIVVGLLGILKAGGAYVPLDPDYPAERLAYMLEDSAPVALLTQATLEERLPVCGVPTLRLDTSEDRALLAAQPTHNPDPHAHGLSSRRLAYVIYTSGSTGTPKGVMVEHRNVNRLVINNPYFQAGDDDCLVHAANPAFDAATWEIWGALLNGARLLVLPPADVLDARRFDAQLLAHGATAMWMTVGLFNQYAPSMQASLAQLRYLLVGGDVLDPRTIRSVLAQAQRPAHLINGYGPTETTTFACTHLIEALAEDATSVPIGRPIANTQVYILDAHGAPVPVGVAGELHIGGDGVARGYLNQPALTAERFVRDPFSADPQARMYKTGDLGRWLPDGTIEYLGRNDFQVKIRGFRIELGEVEAKLSACADVREAVVLAREDVPGDKRLVAYVVPSAGAEPTGVQLREALQTQLPEYMVPSAFMVLDAFPLTPNGKLDRKALPAPDGSSLVQREYEAPQGEIEQGLAEIWQSLLKIEQVGRHDHFFELGGHSLLAVQLVS